jgi:60 kDa SS-A/Ro ribonucleoprotein
MGPTAVLRNLNKLTQLGLLCSEGSANGVTAEAAGVLAMLSDCSRLEKARVHPLDLLVAMDTYAKGHGEKGSLEWDPEKPIVAALEAAFYALTKHISTSYSPSALRVCVGIDLRASMLAQVGSTTARKAAAATAMVWRALQPAWPIFLFGESGTCPLPISADSSLSDVLARMESTPPAPADPASLLSSAADENEQYDAFVVFTARGVYHGDEPLADHLSVYRQLAGKPEAMLISVTMSPSGTAIFDTKEAGMVDLPYSANLLEAVLEECEWVKIQAADPTPSLPNRTTATPAPIPSDVEDCGDDFVDIAEITRSLSGASVS